jgi:molybdenum cofactor guanylyltransferase
LTTCATVIFAGGAGERLGGVNKASLLVGGMPMLKRVHEILRAADGMHFLALGQKSADMFSPLGALVPVPDLPGPLGGPLAGLAAAVARCQQMPSQPQFILTASVDAPLLPAKFPTTMLNAVSQGSPGAIVRYGGQQHPTHGIWRLSALANLLADASTGRGPWSLKHLAAEARAAIVDWKESTDGDPFISLNTISDLVTINHRLAAKADRPS